MKRHDIIRRREALWYPEASRVALLEKLHALATDPPRHRTRSLAIVAEPNAGKTALIRKYLNDHPPIRGEESMEIPAIALRMTNFTRVEDFSIGLLEAIHAPDPGAGLHRDRVKRFVELAKNVKLGLIFLDEFHDCVDTSGRGKPFLKATKNLIEAGCRVIPAGIQEVAEVIALDKQLDTRLNPKPARLERIKDLNVILAIMKELSGFDERDISDAAVSYVLTVTKGILGHVLDVIEGTLIHERNLKLDSLRRHCQMLSQLDGLW